MPKKSNTQSVETSVSRPDRSAADVPVQDRRIALVKQMRKLGATSPVNARGIQELADKLGYTHHDVYCLGFHQYPLCTEGFLKSADVEGIPGVSLYLTAKGQKTDFNEYPFIKKVTPKKAEKAAPKAEKKAEKKAAAKKAPKKAKAPVVKTHADAGDEPAREEPNAISASTE